MRRGNNTVNPEETKKGKAHTRVILEMLHYLAPAERRQCRTREAVTVKYAAHLIPDLADTKLSEVHFLLIQTKWLPGIIFSSNNCFSYLQG